jgi:pimeloyl-ACP methyl ester carboxylesterase
MESIIKRNNVNVIGNGDQVILFTQGFGCDQNAWKFVVDAFTENYKVVLFDYTGLGRSDLSQYTSDKYSKPDDYAHDILDICEAPDLKKVIFVGHSVSNMTLQCSDDIIAPLIVGEYVLQHIPGNKFVRPNAVGYCPHISEPEETIAAIRSYIQRN